MTYRDDLKAIEGRNYAAAESRDDNTDVPRLLRFIHALLPAWEPTRGNGLKKSEELDQLWDEAGKQA